MKKVLLVLMFGIGFAFAEETENYEELLVQVEKEYGEDIGLDFENGLTELETFRIFGGMQKIKVLKLFLGKQ